MQACSQKTLLHKVPHVTVPEPSENPLQMLGKKNNVDREGLSHHVVAYGRHSTDGENETIL